MTDGDWSMVGAVGQWAGALATFLAVIVSLKLSREAARPKVIVQASLSTLLGPPSLDFVSFNFINRGGRPVTITGYGWRARSLWRWDREWMYIFHDAGLLHQQPLPKTLQPGESVMYVVAVSALLSESERLRASFYRKNWIGRFIPKSLYATVNTADGYVFQGRASSSIHNLLRHRDVSRLTGVALNLSRNGGQQ